MTHAPADSHGENPEAAGLALRETSAAGLQPRRKIRANAQKPQLRKPFGSLKSPCMRNAG